MMRPCVLLLCFFLLSVPVAQAASPTVSLQDGEHIAYDISFLWFKRFGKGTLTFEPAGEPGLYRAVAHARTLGVAAWLSRDRQQTYETLMRLDGEGWLRPVYSRSTTLKGKGDERTLRYSQYDYDHSAGKGYYKKFKNGVLYGEQTIDLPTDVRVFDLLSAFYNWRLGRFGEITPGTTFQLPTFSKKGVSELVVGVRTREDQRNNEAFPDTGLLCRVLVDEEVFNTGGGGLFVWLNEAGEPGKLLIQQVLGLGDVWATQRPAVATDNE